MDGLLSVRIETSDGLSLMIKEAGGVSVWLCAGIVVRDDSLKVGGQGHCVTINQDTGFRAGDGLLSRYHAIIMHHIQTSRFLDMIIWLLVTRGVAELGGAAAGGGGRGGGGRGGSGGPQEPAHDRVVRSGGQEIRRSGGQEVRRSGD